LYLSAVPADVFNSFITLREIFFIVLQILWPYSSMDRTEVS
jgi:hypothetical protein